MIMMAEAVQCYLHVTGRGRDAADHPSVHGPLDNNLGCNAGRAEAEKPWLTERYITNQSRPLAPLGQELVHSHTLGSAFFPANTRVCSQGWVQLMPVAVFIFWWGELHRDVKQGGLQNVWTAGHGRWDAPWRGKCSRVASVHFSVGIPKAGILTYILHSRGLKSCRTSQKPVTFWKSYLVLTVEKENESHSLTPDTRL